jgi:hypothetical protein
MRVNNNASVGTLCMYYNEGMKTDGLCGVLLKSLSDGTGIVFADWGFGGTGAVSGDMSRWMLGTELR